MIALMFNILFSVLLTGLCEDVSLGCKIVNNQIQVNKQENQVVWGQNIEPYRTNSQQLKLLVDHIEKVKADIYNEFLLDDTCMVTNIISDYQEYKDKFPQTSFENFLKTYTPSSETAKNRQDNLGLTLKAFEKISESESWSNLRNHYFIAATSNEVGKHQLENFKNLSLALPKEEEIQSIVGIIKIEVDGTVGHIVIDMDNAVTPSPVLMIEGVKGKSKDKNSDPHEYTSFGIPIIYTMERKENPYIQFIKYEVDKERRTKRHNYFKPTSKHVIWIDLPFCSFLHSTTAEFLRKPAKPIVKISPTGKIDVVIMVNFEHPDSINDNIFLVATDDEKMKRIVFNKVEDTTEEEKTIVRYVAERMKMSYEELATKLQILGALVTDYRKIKEEEEEKIKKENGSKKRCET